jgi:hypothetical protein
MTAVATSPLTIHVDADAAGAYAKASMEDQKKIQLILSLRLQELVASADVPLRAVMDQLSDHAEAGGLTPELLESTLHETFNPPTAPVTSRDRPALLRRGRGIWRDRDDLPPLAELRAEWDRD